VRCFVDYVAANVPPDGRSKPRPYAGENAAWHLKKNPGVEIWRPRVSVACGAICDRRMPAGTPALLR